MQNKPGDRFEMKMKEVFSVAQSVPCEFSMEELIDMAWVIACEEANEE